MATMSGTQSRAARVLLRWSQEDLAERAGVNVSSVKRLEAGSTAVSRLVERAVSTVFASAGVVFLADGDHHDGRRVELGVLLCTQEP